MHGNCQNHSKFLLKHSLNLRFWTIWHCEFGQRVSCWKMWKSLTFWTFAKNRWNHATCDCFENWQSFKMKEICWKIDFRRMFFEFWTGRTMNLDYFKPKLLNSTTSNMYIKPKLLINWIRLYQTEKITLETLVSPNLPNSLNIFFGIPTKNPVDIPRIIRILCFLSQFKDFIEKTPPKLTKYRH